MDIPDTNNENAHCQPDFSGLNPDTELSLRKILDQQNHLIEELADAGMSPELVNAMRVSFRDVLDEDISMSRTYEQRGQVALNPEFRRLKRDEHAGDKNRYGEISDLLSQEIAQMEVDLFFDDNETPSVETEEKFQVIDTKISVISLLVDWMIRRQAADGFGVIKLMTPPLIDGRTIDVNAVGSDQMAIMAILDMTLNDYKTRKNRDMPDMVKAGERVLSNYDRLDDLRKWLKAVQGMFDETSEKYNDTILAEHTDQLESHLEIEFGERILRLERVRHGIEEVNLKQHKELLRDLIQPPLNGAKRPKPSHKPVKDIASAETLLKTVISIDDFLQRRNPKPKTAAKRIASFAKDETILMLAGEQVRNFVDIGSIEMTDEHPTLIKLMEFFSDGATLKLGIRLLMTHYDPESSDDNGVKSTVREHLGKDVADRISSFVQAYRQLQYEKTPVD